MQIDVITIFPKMFRAVLGESIIKRAQQAGRLRITLHDLRDYTHDRHRSVDERPYGGGPGMVMRPEPIFEAVEALTSLGRTRPGDSKTWAGAQAGNHHRRAGVRPQTKRFGVGARRGGSRAGCLTVLMSPDGEPLSTALAKELAQAGRLIIICGHYEGVDERVRVLVDRTVSVGDYVLTGGELPAMVLIDCLARFLPGVIGHAQATQEESFADGWLEYPQYTRPPVFRGMAVPTVLRSGDHHAIARWRRLQSVARTATLRPELVAPHTTQKMGRADTKVGRRQGLTRHGRPVPSRRG